MLGALDAQRDTDGYVYVPPDNRLQRGHVHDRCLVTPKDFGSRRQLIAAVVMLFQVKGKNISQNFNNRATENKPTPQLKLKFKNSATNPDPKHKCKLQTVSQKT
jgi:hypothetical protein